MSGEFIELFVSLHQGRYHGVYESSTGGSTAFNRADDACEYFIRLLITTGFGPQFNATYSVRYFKKWLNKQPNKTELVELIDLQEMV